jgi:hypothetical protein
VQYEHLLPLNDSVNNFIQFYNQLADAIFSTTHVLPYSSSADVSVNEKEIENSLKKLDGVFVPSEKSQEMISVGNQLTKTASIVAEEFDTLKQCRNLLIQVEYKLCQVTIFIFISFFLLLLLLLLRNDPCWWTSCKSWPEVNEIAVYEIFEINTQFFESSY